MRILTVASPWLGGSGTVGIELAKSLAKHHQSYFVSFDYPIRSKEKEGNFVFYNLTTFSYALFSHPLFSESLAERIIELCLRHRIQIIHAHYSLVFGTAAIMAKKALVAHGRKIKVVLTFHGTDAVGFDPGNIGKKTFINLNTWLADEADAITTASEWLARYVKKHYRAPRVHVVPNFIDTQIFKRTNDFPQRTTIIHVSNFRPVKRALLVAKTFCALQKKHPSLSCVFIGDGPERKTVKGYIHSRKIKRVVFAGKKSDTELAKYLNRAKALLLPSSFENASLVLYEAMACGTPQITTAVGGTPEVVGDDKTGILIKNDHQVISNLVDACSKLMSEDYWNRLSRTSVSKAKKFDKTIVTTQYESIYASLLKSQNI